MDEIVYNLENQNFDLSNFDYLPAKYILIPILKQTSYDDFDKYYDVTAYIVTKGYIKEKNEKINFNTKHSITYKVLLPFYVNTSLQIEYSESGKEIEVNDIFDTYEEAKEYADEVNQAMFIDSICFYPVKYLKNNYDKEVQQRNEVCQEYNKLENKLTILTDRIPISSINWGKNIESKTLLKKYKKI